MKKIVIICTVLFSTGLWAHDLPMSPYLKMQKALALDDFKMASSIHKQICKKDLGHYEDQYKDCKKDPKDIKELRESFKSLSKLYIEHGKKDEMKGLITAECPMAKAKWVQEEGSIKNPYYGKSMLECGQKI